ncbi:hypothetical protein [Endozoicomonas sp. GU-1]|uniref:hypothetical protein n=1 Tax=Endozoicomonas sp. GU-1 TaxID=3009078 RepID=UPI0022B2BA0D|nr:hypothetical protein [Endozoicomonas sp. GU-1]WBA81088.1 hypothetical protein O2T12_22770 [Endozoicomonas sp. GU-1]WBA88651.1 hypothetical protein O3276_11945 [Endozoicomonas sp. GU-1]
MDIRASTPSPTENHQAPGSDNNSAKVKGSDNISSPSYFSGRDVEVTDQKRPRDSTCDLLTLTKITKTMAETDVLSGKIEPLHVKQHTTVSFQSPMSSSVVSGQPSQIPARKMASPHSLLLSPKELTDQIRLKTYEELKACKTLPVFYVAYPNGAVRLTESAKQRMYDDGLSIDDVKNALHLTTGKSALNQTPQLSFDHLYYIANHKVIVHLMKYAEDNIFKPTVFKPGIDVFEYFNEPKQQWLPAKAERSIDYPEPLIDPRYILMEEIQSHEAGGHTLITDDEKYLADKVAECLTETLGIIWHTLHSPGPDSEKSCLP